MAQCVESVGHEVERFETTLRHHRFYCVQLHLSRIACHRYGEVVPDYFVANLIHNFLRADALKLVFIYFCSS